MLTRTEKEGEGREKNKQIEKTRRQGRKNKAYWNQLYRAASEE